MREGYIMKRMALACFMATYAGARVAFGGLLYEPSCYVAQESLALNLDGIRNVGALKAHDGAATEWKDLSHTANNAVFIAKEGDASAWTADGYHFAGGCYGKLKSAQDFGDAVTVQIVADVTRSDSTTTWPTLFGNWNDRLNLYFSGDLVNFKADHSTGLGPETRARLANWEGKYLNAALDAAAYKQIVVQAASFQTGWVEGSKSGKASVGSQQWSFGGAGNGGNFDQSGLDSRYLVGTIKAIRVYKKVLSNTELAANRAIDEARFFAGIPVTNVVVATAVRAGYTLERRDGAAWGPAQLFAGTAYTSADTNACVRLTWQWRATGGEAGADLDPLLDDYVTDGLLLHVDGIRNVGADKPHDNAASAWVDLVGGKVAPFYHDADDASAWREDGYYFGGTSYAQFTAQLAGLTNTVTVQVVCDTVPSQLKRTVTWPNLVGCNDWDSCNVYYNTSGQLTFKNAGGGNVYLASDTWLGHYATAIRAGTTNYVTQGTTLAGAVKKETAQGNISTVTVRIGSAGSTLDKRKDRWFTGVIKAVRIYDRVLSDAELEQNRAIDEVRFFGAALPVTNVVVASSVRGISGDAPEGAYMLSAGGHTFTAPATMTSGDDTYSCTGYTLETWDDATGTWSTPVSYASSSYNATDTTAKVRLTWQWTHTAGPGFDAAFNDYVTDGLVIHLDGIRNTGLAPVHDDTAETWADLSDSGGYARLIRNADDGSAWAADGYTLGGKEYYGGRSYVQMSGSRTLDGPYTIQEVLDFDRERANRINVPWPGLMGTTDTGDKLAYYYNMPNVGTPDVRLKVMNTYLYQISGWGGDYVTAIFNGTQTASFKGATTAGVTWKDFTYVPGTRTFTFGSGNGGGSGYADRYLTGTIKGVRFYNRALTDAELARNRAADEIRFFGRAPAATGELLVASDVKGLNGNQPCGMYRPAGAYTFTAPAEAWLDDTPYECSGYTLETWDGSAWGSPVVYDGILAVAPDLSAASRRLTWNWRVKSRLTRVRSDYDVDDYVQTDLYLHLDGIRNAGATADHDAAATTWADLANGNDATFDFANAGVTGDGWTDNGYRFVYGGKFAGLPDTLNFGSVVTIQAVCDVGKSGKTSGSSWQMLFGATNDFFNVYTGDGNGNTIVFKIFNNQAQVKDANNVITTYTGGRQQMSGTWTGKYITAIWSAGKYTVFQDAVPDPGRWAGTWRYNWEALTGRPFYVGGVYIPESAGETNNRRLTGTIHALRVYKRALSDAELEHNRIVDEARFFGNLPESNVVVVDAGGEQAESGIYKVDGTWTFTATTARGDNNEIKPVKGYTLDMWDGSAWIRAASGQGDSYTYTVGTSSAKVRLTWNALPSGTVLIVR